MSAAMSGSSETGDGQVVVVVVRIIREHGDRRPQVIFVDRRWSVIVGYRGCVAGRMVVSIDLEVHCSGGRIIIAVCDYQGHDMFGPGRERVGHSLTRAQISRAFAPVIFTSVTWGRVGRSGSIEGHRLRRRFDAIE